MSENNIGPTAGPFFFPGRSNGRLPVHGYTGTPKEMRASGDHLAGKGSTLLWIRLAGHATHSRDLPRIAGLNGWENWRKDANEICWIEDSDHNITNDSAKQEVFQGAEKFISRVNEIKTTS